MRNASDEVRNPEPLTIGDADAIADQFQAPSVAGVAPLLTGSARVSVGGESKNTSVNGVTPAYQEVRNMNLKEGIFISQEHILGRASVVVIGTEVADKLFGRKEGLEGETIRIEGQPYRIIGILEEKGGSSFNNEDDQIIVPLTTAQTRLLRRQTSDRVDMILAQAITADAVPEASEEIAQILRTRHRTEIGADYRVADWNDIVALYSDDIGTFCDMVGLDGWGEGYNIMIMYNGDEFWSLSNRHYFITRFDHTKPSYYLSHANIDDHFLDLGNDFLVQSFCADFVH